MFKSLILLNKAGYVLAAATIVLTAFAYRPVSNIFSSNSSVSQPTCSVAGAGRTVLQSSTTLFANGGTSQVGPLSANIPAGQYNVYYQSFDAHSVHGDQGQNQEQWFIQGRNNGSIQWVSATTPDLAANKDVQSGLLQSRVTIPALNSVVLKHAGGPGAQSIVPSCVAFERISEPVACQLPAADGRIINANSVRLLANGLRQVGPFAINLPAGTYNVAWQSFDEHSVHGGQNQTQEQWNVIYLKNGVEVGVSSTTADLPEGQDVITGTFRGETVPMADAVIFRHAAPASAGPQSVEPSCVSFDRQAEPVVTCDALDASKLSDATFKFTASASARNGASISNYTINFGDGNSTTTANGMAEHTYANPGTYTVRATANGSTGAITSAACVETVTVEEPAKVVDLELTKLVAINNGARVEADSASTAPQGFVGDTVTWTLIAKNNGPDTATNVTVADAVPAAFDLVGNAPSRGSVNGSIWTIGTLRANETAQLVITTTASATGDFVNRAQVATHTENDVDSTPGNGLNRGEDDDNPAFVEIITRPPQTAQLGDRVWEDLNGNGIQDAGEPGVAGVTVILQRPDGSEVRRTTTGTNGEYLFTDLAPGQYKVTFVSPTGFEFTQANEGNDAQDSDANRTTGMTQTVTLVAGDDNRTLDAGIVVKPELSALGDRVWIDANKNGVQDLGEDNLPGVRVQLLDENGNVIRTQFTGSNGEYLFTNLQPGTYSVVFTTPTGFTFTSSNAGGNDAQDSDANQTTGATAQVTLAPGETNRTVDAGVVPIPVPVFTCDAIRVTQTGDRSYTATADFTTKNTTLVNYVFSIFSDTGVRTATSPTPTFNFTTSDTGAHVLTAQIRTTDGISGIDECQYSFNEEAQIDLSLEKTVEFGDSNGSVDADTEAEAPTGTVGSDAQWTITVRNEGPDTATGVEVTDLLPSGVSFVTHATAKGSFNPATAVWTVGSLAADEEATLLVVTTVDELGTITNLAGVTAADQPDPDSTPNDAIDGNEDDEDPAVIRSEENQTASLGDKVWFDRNGNGVQDADEPGVDNITVILVDADGNEVDRQQTRNGGEYLFTGLAPGDYKVTFELLDGYEFTDSNAGSDDSIDSDADQVTGMTQYVTLAAGQALRSLDAGLVITPTTEPIVRCVGLNVVKLTDNTFRFELAIFTQDATATNFQFSVNGQVVKSGSEQTMEFTATKAGTYTIGGEVTFDVNGETVTRTCPEASVEITETGVVLGTNTPSNPVVTPTILPNTGPGTVISALGAGMAVLAAHAWLVSRRQLLSSSRS